MMIDDFNDTPFTITLKHGEWAAIGTALSMYVYDQRSKGRHSTDLDKLAILEHRMLMLRCGLEAEE